MIRPSNQLANTTDMEFALSRVAQRFKVGDGFILTQFKDGATKCQVVLDSEHYQVAVTFKNKYEDAFPSVVGTEEEVEEESTEE